MAVWRVEHLLIMGERESDTRRHFSLHRSNLERVSFSWSVFKSEVLV